MDSEQKVSWQTAKSARPSKFEKVAKQITRHVRVEIAKQSILQRNTSGRKNLNLVRASY